MNLETGWERVERLFAEALEQPEHKREAYVRARCADDAAAREEVLRLIDASRRMGGFLETPLLDLSGQTFGRYVAREEIGRGGMSVVYRGERQGGDFEQEVAIKVILLQSAETARAGETSILARLEHPNVARLLDSGLTAQGFRYLVMELVRGKPCTEFAAGLPERRKLLLFLQICAGVQAAHRAMVVHRDLKPGNILVTADGTVKLLDFGIAKMLAAEEASRHTTVTRAFTPDYASPEQILGQPVTPASDIYSLGVLLCELVGGKAPRELSGLGLGDMVRRADSEDTGTVPLGGDLGAIARKALRRDPAQRYASANELARDIERYLSGLPIEARPPSRRYWAGRFIARHRYAVAAAGLAVTALAVAAGVAIWQARLASQRFEQVRELAGSVLFELYDAVNPLPGSLQARKLIVDRGLKYLDALAKDSHASDAVRLDVARGFLRLSEIQGKDFGGASLFQTAEALDNAERALAIARDVAARNPRDRAAQLVLLDALDYTTTAYLMRKQPERSVPFGEELLRRARQLAAAAPRDRKIGEQLAGAAKQLASAYMANGQLELAIEHYRQAVERRRELYAAYADTPSQQRLAESHNWLASALYRTGAYEEAEKHVRESYRLNQERARTQPRQARPNLAADIGQLAALAAQRGRHEEVVPLYEEQLRIRREILADEPQSATAKMRVAASLDRLGDAYQRLDKFPEAIRHGEEALRMARSLHAADPGNLPVEKELLHCLLDLTVTYSRAGKQRMACPLAREGLELFEKMPAAVQAEVRRTAARVREIAVGCGR